MTNPNVPSTLLYIIQCPTHDLAHNGLATSHRCEDARLEEGKEKKKRQRDISEWTRYRDDWAV
jgi:hypothetical protein